MNGLNSNFGLKKQPEATGPMSFGNYNAGLGQYLGPKTVLGGSEPKDVQDLTMANYNAALGTFETTFEFPKSTMSKTAAFSFGAILLAALAFFGYKTVSEKQEKDGKSLTTRVTDGATKAAASVKSAAQAAKRFVQNKDNAFALKAGLAVAATGLSALAAYKFGFKKDEGFIGQLEAGKDYSDYTAVEQEKETIYDLEDNGFRDWYLKELENKNTGDCSPYSQIGNDASADFPNGIWSEINSDTTSSQPKSVTPNFDGYNPDFGSEVVRTRTAFDPEINPDLGTAKGDPIPSSNEEQASVDNGFMSGILKMFGRNDVMTHIESNHEPVNVDERDTVFRFPRENDTVEVGMDSDFESLPGEPRGYVT